MRKVNIRPKKYACDSGRWPRLKFVRHHYVLRIDSDGNYRCCERCGLVSLRLAAGERDRVR